MFKYSLLDRIHSLVLNDIASYPAICILNRVSKDGLVAFVHEILPEMPKLVSLFRFNVIKTLFGRY